MERPTEGLDADGLRSYRMALAREARRFKRYPRPALEAGWAGTTEVTVAVTAAGGAADPRISRSSGYPVLDEAALEMMSRALAATAVPPILLGQAFAVSLPVVFELPSD
jgi:protein TonB